MASIAARYAIPCSIQPHGILLVLGEPELAIHYISENVEALVGIAAKDACGATLEIFMAGQDARAFRAKLREPQLIGANPYLLTLRGPAGKTLRVECSAYRLDGGRLIVELEATGDSNHERSELDVLGPIERLQTAPGIEALLASAARDIAAMSGFDRVLIYRFEGDGQGVVVAESTAVGLDVLYLGQHFPATDLPEETRDLYLRNALHVIPDTAYVPARLIGPSCAAAGVESVDLSRATLRNVRSYRFEYVERSNVRATMTISIIIRGRLWGLIACQHSAPRRITYAKRSIFELMGHMLAWQLGARIEAAQEERHKRETELAVAIGNELESHDDLFAALIACTPHLLELFAAGGIAIHVGDKVSRGGTAPGDDAIEFAVAAALLTGGEHGGVAATNELATTVPQTLGSSTAGALCIQLAEDGTGFILVFRPEVIRSVIWGQQPTPEHGGKPGYRTWRQTVRGQCTAWTSENIAAAQSLARLCAGRLQHLTEKRAERMTHLNADLEQRNARAEALIKLQDDVAAALPSRAAVIGVVLDFAQRQTYAGGSVLETLTESESIFDAATGSLAPHVGLRMLRAGSFSARSADLHEALVCDDTFTEIEEADRAVCTRLHIGSMVAVPIPISASSTLVLKVVSPRRWAFSEADVSTLKAAATNLLGALRAAQKFTAMAAAELEQRTYARQLRALHTIASTTTSHRKDQIDAALHLGLEQLGLDWAYLGVIDYATAEFVIESSVGTNGHVVVPDGTRMPLGSTIIGRIAPSKRVIIVEDIATLPDQPLYAGWNAYIAVPLFIGGTNYGAIGFTSREVRSEPFSEANIEFLAVAGELIASAIERGLQRDQLENSQSRYRALTEAIPQMMWVIDSTNQFEYVNERWTQYTGLTLEQSRSAARDEIYFPADFLDAALGRPLPPVESDCEVRVRRADGAYRWHLMRSVPFRSVGGDVDRWLVTATDIEARKSGERLLADVHDAALAATEAKSRFLATMSHEIRTPMNGVIGMTELLLLTPLNDEQREYTEIIRDSGQSLLRVLNDILDYSKIEAGKLELETVRFDLPGQVESVVELLRPGFTAKGVKLSTHIAADVRTAVVGDPGRLRQILLNLAGNALKFTATGGTVAIVVSTDSADADVSPVRFTIKDSGIGIPPDVLERLFQPFSQGDESTTRKFGGTGLGLSISAELVTLMGGEIGVESVPEVGSGFWFVIPFPLAPNSQKVADARLRLATRSEPAPIRPERILLVEDNEINTFLAIKQLQRLGFAITAVTNGRQAVETVSREHYDLILMDCHMPEMDGFEATRAIRKLETGTAPHLPIVAMTADARDEDHQNCLLAGMDDYISKPTNLDSLRAVLDRWLPAPERRRASRIGTPPFNTAPTLGMSMLLELFNGDRAAVLDLLAAALGAIMVDLKRIEVAAAARDFETVTEAAHRLKGTSGSIRSGRLVEISAAIEAEARTGPGSISPALLAELQAAVAGVSAEVQQKTADPTSLR